MINICDKYVRGLLYCLMHALAPSEVAAILLPIARGSRTVTTSFWIISRTGNWIVLPKPPHMSSMTGTVNTPVSVRQHAHVHPH